MEIDLDELMSGKSEEGLMVYVQKAELYTDEAIVAALKELKKRGRTFSDRELETIQIKLEEKRKAAKVERSATAGLKKMNRTSLTIGIMLLIMATMSALKKAPASRDLTTIKGNFKSIERDRKGFVKIILNGYDYGFLITPATGAYFDYNGFLEEVVPGNSIELSVNKNDLNIITSHLSLPKVVTLKANKKAYLTTSDYNRSLKEDLKFVWGFVFNGLFLVYLGVNNKPPAGFNLILIFIIFLLSITIGIAT